MGRVPSTQRQNAESFLVREVKGMFGNEGEFILLNQWDKEELSFH